MTLTDSFFCAYLQGTLSHETCIKRQATRAMYTQEDKYISYQGCYDCEQGQKIAKTFSSYKANPKKVVQKREYRKGTKHGQSAYTSHYEAPPVVSTNTPSVAVTREMQEGVPRKVDLPGGLSQSEIEIADLLDALGRSPY